MIPIIMIVFHLDRDGEEVQRRCGANIAKIAETVTSHIYLERVGYKEK